MNKAIKEWTMTYFSIDRKNGFSLQSKKLENKKGFSISRKKCQKEIETLSWRIQRAFLSQKQKLFAYKAEREREEKRQVENSTKINYTINKINVTDYGMVKRNKMKAMYYCTEEEIGRAHV